MALAGSGFGRPSLEKNVAGLRPRGRETPPAPGVGRGGSPGLSGFCPSAEVNEDLEGRAGSRSRRAPWGTWSLMWLCCHGESLWALNTLVRALPTASLARMCARRGNLLHKKIVLFFFF